MSAEQVIYGFIGVGNMGGALAKALAQTIPGERILLSNRTVAKAEALAAELGARAASVTEVAATADVVLLGVKPQNLAELFAEIGSELASRATPPILVSMAAGRSIADIRGLAKAPEAPVIRLMPNLPVSVSEGVTLVCAEGVAPETLATFKADFAAAGEFVDLPEAQFDAGMAISGCGPAFAFMFADALAQGGVAAGLPEEVALALAEQTMRGSAALMQASDKTPAALTQAVCSPGGTTIEGVEVLRAADFADMVAAAVQASYKKASAIK